MSRGQLTTDEVTRHELVSNWMSTFRGGRGLEEVERSVGYSAVVLAKRTKMGDSSRARRRSSKLNRSDVSVSEEERILQKHGLTNWDDGFHLSRTGEPSVLRIEPLSLGKENKPCSKRSDRRDPKHRRSASESPNRSEITREKISRKDGDLDPVPTSVINYVSESLRKYSSVAKTFPKAASPAADGIVPLPPDLLALSQRSCESDLIGGTSLPVVDFQRRAVRSRFSAARMRIMQDNTLGKRLLYSTKTTLRMGTYDDCGDSDDEYDPEWQMQDNLRNMDDIVDVNEGEGALMKMWNLHRMKYNIVGASMMPLAMDLFIREFGLRIVNHNLMRNFSVMCQLFLEEELLSQSAILRAHLALRAIRQRVRIPPPIDTATITSALSSL